MKNNSNHSALNRIRQMNWWTIVLLFCFLTGMFFSALTAIVSLIYGLGLCDRTEQHPAIITVLLLSALLLAGSGSHAMDKYDEARRDGE